MPSSRGSLDESEEDEGYDDENDEDDETPMSSDQV